MTTHRAALVVSLALSACGGPTPSTNGRSTGHASTGLFSSSAASGNVSGDYCGPCQQDSDCGGGNTFCLEENDGFAYCGTDCSLG